MFVPKLWLFSISLMVCEFNPHRQTFTGTYPPLADSMVLIYDVNLRLIYDQNKKPDTVGQNSLSH